MSKTSYNQVGLNEQEAFFLQAYLAPVTRDCGSLGIGYACQPEPPISDTVTNQSESALLIAEGESVPDIEPLDSAFNEVMDEFAEQSS